MTNIEPDTVQEEAEPELPQVVQGRRRWTKALSFKNIGAIYTFIVLIIIFSFWAPKTFPTYTTVAQVLNENSITGLMALSLIIPLSAGVFDLSIGYSLGLCNVLVAHLIVGDNMSPLVAIVLTLVCALGIGLLNAIVVVVFKIDSLIATLATGSLLLAGITIVAGQTEIVGPGLSNGVFEEIGNLGIHGIDLPVFYMLVVAFIIWFVLERTVGGRQLYASGYNPDASRLAGIPVNRLRFISLIVSALVAGGIAGICVTSQIAAGSATVGPPYLLNAFAAAFLGATQLRQGRFNPWGTLIAVLLLGAGTTGLALANTPSWAPSVFTGVVLLVALGITRAERRASL
jgi:ribose transport system permease protein